MISHPNIDQIKTILEQDTTLVINSGCTFEYNMNTLVDNITMTGAQISRTDAAGIEEEDLVILRQVQMFFWPWEDDEEFEEMDSPDDESENA